MSSPYVLCTGGLGFVGSHTVITLLKQGYRVAIVDNLSNASITVLDRIEEAVGKRPAFFQLDLAKDVEKVDGLFAEQKFNAVIHFASLKAVGESIEMPLAYYNNNIGGTLALLESMAKHNCKTMVFSSSATVYKPREEQDPLDESQVLGPTNPYGQTKMFIEQILQDVFVSDNTWSVELLRYFNPTGAIQSGRLGEHPQGIPNNLMPYVQQVAIGTRTHLNVFGSDWPTADGTCIRDFIHVMDLAEGHVAALKFRLGKPGCDVHNLGSGRGYSVLEMVEAFRKASGKEIPVKFTDRRAGDICCVVSDPKKAEKDFGWKTTRNVDDMCRDSWKWQSNNPNGYSTEQ
eukprot:GEMP01016720.1.p1 GENE.GEMP01016720.1~~GEMP01016720.1.p1  ORF type:complete len:389 (+),score=89.63 GEMP01016720.1:133-1167(+)